LIVKTKLQGCDSTMGVQAPTAKSSGLPDRRPQPIAFTNEIRRGKVRFFFALEEVALQRFLWKTRLSLVLSGPELRLSRDFWNCASRHTSKDGAGQQGSQNCVTAFYAQKVSAKVPVASGQQ